MAGEPSLLRSLSIQKRVLHALFMREVITRFGRDNLGALWLMVEPMLFTLGIATLWHALSLNHGSAIPIVAFAITGYSSVLLWRNCATRCSMAIESNLGLLFHRNVRVMDIFLTRILLEVVGATGSFLILSFAFIAAGVISPPIDMAKVVAGWLLLTWIGTCMGLLIGAGTAHSLIIEKLWHPGAYLLFPISGAAFMVDWLPRSFQEVVLLLPMVHALELVRDGFFGNVVRTHYSISYVLVVCLVANLFGLVLVRGAARKVEAR